MGALTFIVVLWHKIFAHRQGDLGLLDILTDKKNFAKIEKTIVESFSSESGIVESGKLYRAKTLAMGEHFVPHDDYES